MAAYKEFTSNKLTLRYFPDSKVVFLIPQKGIPGHYLNLVKSKLETFLQIDSVKQENGGISLKLDQKTTSPEELFRSFGFGGGMDVDDAASVARRSSESDLEDEKAQEPKPAANGLKMPPGGSNAPPGGTPEEPLPPQQESLKLMTDLFEKSFWKAFKKKGKVGASKKSGKYWKDVESRLGKNREKIIPKDILHLRKKLGLQPRSIQRNKSLQALDRAYRYFLGKIRREKGEHSRDLFKNEYDSQTNLKPSDYIQGKHEKIDNDSFGEQGGGAGSMSIQDLDLDLDLGAPGISFDDIEIENDSVPTL